MSVCVTVCYACVAMRMCDYVRTCMHQSVVWDASAVHTDCFILPSKSYLCVVSVWHLLLLSVLCPAEHNLPAAVDREASEQPRNVLWSQHWTETGPHEEGTNVRTYVRCACDMVSLTLYCISTYVRRP